MLLLATGCFAPPPADSAETETTMAAPSEKLSPEEFAAVQGKLEDLFPSLEDAAADSVELSMRSLRESSCFGPEVTDRQTQTSWLGILRGVPADDAAANAAIDALSLQLQEDNWTLVEEYGTPDVEIGQVRLVYLEQDQVNLRLIHERGYPDKVEVLASTGCYDHPQDHRMQRSRMDPEYGTSSQEYPDGA
jgi:hypothetical protein